MSRPLRSTPPQISRSFTATTGRSASERRVGTQCLRCDSLGTLPLATQGPAIPIALSTLAFSRSAREPQIRLTPPIRRAPPGQERAPARLIPRGKLNPRFRCHLSLSTPQRRRPAHSGPSALERLPDPHLTRSSPAFPLIAHHDGLQPTQHQGGLAPAPAGPTLEGQQSSISRTAPPM